ncbi:hypothetical protein BH11PSE7_BH11PSE7_28810 [soil metagenome]
MIRYVKFFINGGVLGLLSLGLQALAYWLIGGNSGIEYAAASTIACVPLIFLNYAIQRAWIFKSEGLFRRFVLANLAIMALMSILSPACRALIGAFSSAEWGDRLGFAIANLISSVPSFLLQKHFVFNRGRVEKTEASTRT